MNLKEKVLKEMVIKRGKKNPPAPIRVFKVEEIKGSLPYILLWIGAHKLPSLQHYTHLTDAVTAKTNLEALGVRASLLIDFHNCKMAKNKVKQLNSK